MSTERESYEAPEAPVVVGSLTEANISYSGSGGDFSFYSSLPV